MDGPWAAGLHRQGTRLLIGGGRGIRPVIGGGRDRPAKEQRGEGGLSDQPQGHLETPATPEYNTVLWYTTTRTTTTIKNPGNVVLVWCSGGMASPPSLRP